MFRMRYMGMFEFSCNLSETNMKYLDHDQSAVALMKAIAQNYPTRETSKTLMLNTGLNLKLRKKL